jgi:hypothetical protein
VIPEPLRPFMGGLQVLTPKSKWPTITNTVELAPCGICEIFIWMDNVEMN